MCCFVWRLSVMPEGVFTMRSEQNGWHLADNISKCIILNDNTHCILTAISLNSLAPGRSECDSKNVIFNLVLLIGIFRFSHHNTLRWLPPDLTDDKSTLVQVMAWCRQATSHYLSQCWLSSLSPYGVARPQWVKLVPKGWIDNQSALIQAMAWHSACDKPLPKNDDPIYWWKNISADFNQYAHII